MHPSNQLAGQSLKPSDDAAANVANARLLNILERLSMAEDRLGRVVTRAFGDPLTGKDASNGPKAIPAGTLGAMSDSLDQIDTLVTNIESRISRIDQII